MNETLWRDGVRLGEIVIDTPATRGGIAGMFVPTPAFTDIAPLWQVRIPILPGSPVFEHRLTDVSVGGFGSRAQGSSSHAVSTEFPLEPMSDEEAKGIPARLQLELRDTDGRRLDIASIMLHRFPIPPRGTKSEIWDACEAAGVEPSGWLIGAFPPGSSEDREDG